MAPLSPELILTNGRVFAPGPAGGRASSVGVGSGRILFLNNVDFRGQKAKGTEVIDCRGGAILPGFIDAHCHLGAYAQGLVTLSLEPRRGIRSLDDIRRAVGDLSRTLPAGGWIRGRGYDEFHLAEKRHPNRHDLDGAAPDNPVKIAHRTGRAHVLNSLGLALAGITVYTPDPPDGIIERDLQTAEPTGVLYGMGAFLADRVPSLTETELLKGVAEVNNNLLAAGVTSIQDASAQNDGATWRMLENWKKKGVFLPRIRMMRRPEAATALSREDFSSPLPAAALTAGGVKIVIDATTGRLLPEQRDMNEMVFEVHRLGFQIAFHALEEDAIEAACRAVEYALEKHPRRDHRHRIEHCSVCPPELAARLAAAGMMVVTQPGFVYYNGEKYLQTVPASQLPHLYPLASLYKRGIAVAGSSDFPVAPPDPLTGIYAAVNRRSETGEALLPQEALTSAQALLLYTENAARSAFEENDKGIIAPGKIADLIVLDKDPTDMEGEEIRNLHVTTTVIGGKVVWQRK